MTSGRNADAQAAGAAKSDEPVKFDNIVLEITRTGSTSSSREGAAKPMADGPNGPEPFRPGSPRWTRQSEIYEKEVEAINEWDEERRDHERCVADAIVALQDQRGPTPPDPATMTELAQLAHALAAAQARANHRSAPDAEAVAAEAVYPGRPARG